MIPGQPYASNPPAHLSRDPVIHPSAFIAPSADILGNVTIGEEASIWYQAVLRGDINEIVVGARSNIQDGSIVHISDDYGVRIGELVTCGHRCILHACSIDDEVLVGMGATVMDGVKVGARSIIGASSLVTMDTEIPPGSLVLGAPAKVVRTLDLTEQRKIKSMAQKYVNVSRHFLARD